MPKSEADGSRSKAWTRKLWDGTFFCTVLGEHPKNITQQKSAAKHNLGGLIHFIDVHCWFQLSDAGFVRSCCLIPEFMIFLLWPLLVGTICVLLVQSPTRKTTPSLGWIVRQLALESNSSGATSLTKLLLIKSDLFAEQRCLCSYGLKHVERCWNHQPGIWVTGFGHFFSEVEKGFCGPSAAPRTSLVSSDQSGVFLGQHEVPMTKWPEMIPTKWYLDPETSRNHKQIAAKMGSMYCHVLFCNRVIRLRLNGPKGSQCRAAQFVASCDSGPFFVPQVVLNRIISSTSKIGSPQK